jgi:hypothetical protein
MYKVLSQSFSNPDYKALLRIFKPFSGKLTPYTSLTPKHLSWPVLRDFISDMPVSDKLAQFVNKLFKHHCITMPVDVSFFKLCAQKGIKLTSTEACSNGVKSLFQLKHQELYADLVKVFSASFLAPIYTSFLKSELPNIQSNPELYSEFLTLGMTIGVFDGQSTGPGRFTPYVLSELSHGHFASLSQYSFLFDAKNPSVVTQLSTLFHHASLPEKVAFKKLYTVLGLQFSDDQKKHLSRHVSKALSSYESGTRLVSPELVDAQDDKQVAVIMRQISLAATPTLAFENARFGLACNLDASKIHSAVVSRLLDLIQTTPESSDMTSQEFVQIVSNYALYRQDFPEAFPLHLFLLPLFDPATNSGMIKKCLSINAWPVLKYLVEDVKDESLFVTHIEDYFKDNSLPRSTNFESFLLFIRAFNPESISKKPLILRLQLDTQAKIVESVTDYICDLLSRELSTSTLDMISPFLGVFLSPFNTHEFSQKSSVESTSVQVIKSSQVKIQTALFNRFLRLLEQRYTTEKSTPAQLQRDLQRILRLSAFVISSSDTCSYESHQWTTLCQTSPGALDVTLTSIIKKQDPHSQATSKSELSRFLASACRL